MQQLLLDNRSGELTISQLPDPVLGRGEILIRTAWSIISTGTERAAVASASSSVLERAVRRPDQVRMVLESVRDRGIRETVGRVQRTLNKTVPLGYCYSGVVQAVALDIRDIAVGQRVAGVGWGEGSHAEMLAAPRNHLVKVPDGVELRDSAFVGVGSIALEGVRRAKVQLGDRVLVSGLGLLGLLAGQLLRAAGCHVFGLDPDVSRLRRAEELGFDAVSSTDAATLSHRALSFTDGEGFDACLITAHSASADPLQTAVELSRVRGRIVIVGVVDVRLNRDLMYAKEIEVTISRAFGPGSYDERYQFSGIDYPAEFVRWAANRNMAEFVHLLGRGDVVVAPLITHQVPFSDAPTVYAGMLQRPSDYVGVALDFGQSPQPQASSVAMASRRLHAGGDVGVGFVGAGSFARAVLLPVIRHERGSRLVGVANASPVSSSSIAREFDFEYATADAQRILDDPNVQCVFIGTRHNLHARFVADALRNGKHVFVEKPLALSLEELSDVIAAYESNPSLLMVGFNRRFAPLVQKTKEFFAQRSTPLVVNYRVNAGPVDPDSWPQDPEVGGGRILGEVCHFVDTISFLTDATARRVSTSGVRAQGLPALTWDNVITTLELADGCIASITYAALGHEASRGVRKERIEVFGEGGVAIVDGFREATFSRRGKTDRSSARRADYGHESEVKSFFSALRGETALPVAFTNYVSTTLTTLAIQESLDRGVAVDIGTRRHAGAETSPAELVRTRL